MKTLRNLSLAVLSASSLLLSGVALAHDPALHEPAQKAKPTTCKQLADTTHYAADPVDPEIKALKARCDAAKKSTESETKKKSETPVR
ncbi:TPA: hypothetical protein UOJ00_003004 [Stenotrophomonas maltophilia]|nr:hypothetical protein [Stenotrophomonas maltophilia]